MTGFEFRADDIELDRKKLIDDIVYHAKDFGFVEQADVSDLREFLDGQVSPGENYVIHKSEWDKRKSNYEKFVFLLALAGVRPTQLTPFLHFSKINYLELSESGLLKLHDAIRSALREDDVIPSGQPKPYGVREFADWRVLANEIERALDAKGIDYDPIEW